MDKIKNCVQTSFAKSEAEELQEIKEELRGIKKELQEIKERLDFTQMGQALDRKRIFNIELLLRLDDSLSDHENAFYEEYKKTYENLFSKSIFPEIVHSIPSHDKNIPELVYEELKRVPSMKNKDILDFLGWEKSCTMKATRLMSSMPKFYADVICENVPNRKRAKRIYIKFK